MPVLRLATAALLAATAGWSSSRAGRHQLLQHLAHHHPTKRRDRQYSAQPAGDRAHAHPRPGGHHEDRDQHRRPTLPSHTRRQRRQPRPHRPASTITGYDSDHGGGVDKSRPLRYPAVPGRSTGRSRPRRGRRRGRMPPATTSSCTTATSPTTTESSRRGPGGGGRWGAHRRHAGPGHRNSRDASTAERQRHADPDALGRTKSVPVVPGRPNLLRPCPRRLGLPALTRQDTTRPDILGHILGHLRTRSSVRHPGTSKPPTAFPLVGGPSSVSTQSAPEGIRTPNLLIRSNSIDPTPTEAAGPQTKPDQMFAQVTGVRTPRAGPVGVVTEPRSRGILGHILATRGPVNYPSGWAIEPTAPRLTVPPPEQASETSQAEALQGLGRGEPSAALRTHAGLSSHITGRPVPSSTQPDHTLPEHCLDYRYAGTDDEDAGTRPLLHAKHLTFVSGSNACLQGMMTTGCCAIPLGYRYRPSGKNGRRDRVRAAQAGRATASRSLSLSRPRTHCTSSADPAGAVSRARGESRARGALEGEYRYIQDRPPPGAR